MKFIARLSQNNFVLLHVLVLGCLLFIGHCHAARKPKLRDPFSCSHSHSTMPVQEVASAPAQIPGHIPINSITDDASSEWRVIAEKGNSVVMQHRDGSIREIRLGKQ